MTPAPWPLRPYSDTLTRGERSTGGLHQNVSSEQESFIWQYCHAGRNKVSCFSNGAGFWELKASRKFNNFTVFSYYLGIMGWQIVHCECLKCTLVLIGSILQSESHLQGWWWTEWYKPTIHLALHWNDSPISSSTFKVYCQMGINYSPLEVKGRNRKPQEATKSSENLLQKAEERHQSFTGG